MQPNLDAYTLNKFTIMQTRSQTKQMLCALQRQTQREVPQFEVLIDFNEASSAWKANKKSIGN